MASLAGDGPGDSAIFGCRVLDIDIQGHGTVLDWNERGELGCAVEDIETLDERRLAVGLSSFGEAVNESRRCIVAEGGGPPAAYAAYREATEPWARQAG